MANTDVSTANHQGHTHAHEHSYKYYINRDCQFYPCHKIDDSGFNCLFCYCPLYSGECPGEPVMIMVNGKELKDCSECEFPHRTESYDDIIRCLMERIRS